MFLHKNAFFISSVLKKIEQCIKYLTVFGLSPTCLPQNDLINSTNRRKNIFCALALSWKGKQ